MSRRLPIIKTCGDCSHNAMRFFSSDTGRVCLHDEDNPRHADRDSEPPHWCPLRTGPLEASR